MQQYFFLLGSSGELAIQTVLVIMTIYFVSIHCTSQYFFLHVSDHRKLPKYVWGDSAIRCWLEQVRAASLQRSCELQVGPRRVPLQGLDHTLQQLTFHTPWWSSGWRPGMRHSVLRENWQNRSSDRYSQELILWARFLYLLLSRKALKPFWWWLFLMTGRNLQKICAWLHVFPLHQNHINTDTTPTSLEQFLRAIWGAISQAIVLTLPPIKYNPKLSCYRGFRKENSKGSKPSVVRERMWKETGV